MINSAFIAAMVLITGMGIIFYLAGRKIFSDMGKVL